MSNAKSPLGTSQLPHNLEAEAGVLACILLDNEGTIDAFSRLSEADFYSPSHKLIFNAMHSVYEKNTPVDLVTVVSALTSAGKLDSVGGVAYITSLNELHPSSANFRHYLELLKGARTSRKLINAATHIIETTNSVSEPSIALAAAEKAIFDIAREDERKELTTISSELPSVLERLDAIHKDPASLRGLETGIFGLDRLTNGLHKSDLVVIAARPSVGKTSLGLNIALHAAISRKAKVAVFSLEMSKQSLTTRSLCMLAKVSLAKATKGELDANEWKRIWDANKHLAKANFYIDDNSIITPAEIMRKCMRLKRESGLDLVMIDYLGLMTSGNVRRESRQVEVADNSRMIKIMAKELDVPVLLLSQLNRGIESRRGVDAKPMLSDLRESGAIEQDADLVVFIHKERQVGEDGEEDVSAGASEDVELVIAKQRNGPLGNVKIKWVGEYTSFIN